MAIEIRRAQAQPPIAGWNMVGRMFAHENKRGTADRVHALDRCRPVRQSRYGLILHAPPDQSASLTAIRSEEHTSELQSLMRISYAVFCLKKKNKLHTEIQQRAPFVAKLFTKSIAISYQTQQS